jgi:hypothetical protein
MYKLRASRNQREHEDDEFIEDFVLWRARLNELNMFDDRLRELIGERRIGGREGRDRCWTRRWRNSSPAHPVLLQFSHFFNAGCKISDENKKISEFRSARNILIR